MPGLTNKVKAEMLALFFREDPAPVSFFLALVTNDNVPGPDTNTMADLTEIAAGNSYVAGGQAIARDNIDFPTSTEDDAGDKGVVGLKNITFTASGGPIPTSGNGARYAVLTDDNVTISSRKVYLWFDLFSEKFLSDTQELQLNGMNAELVES